jgi:hypothetical protein
MVKVSVGAGNRHSDWLRGFSSSPQCDDPAHTYWNCQYWLDLGNNADSGQFVLGQPENQRNKARELRLPTASELFPELINTKLDKKDSHRAAR